MGPPTPSPASVCVSPLGPKGSDDWIESLALWILCATKYCVTNSAPLDLYRVAAINPEFFFFLLSNDAAQLKIIRFD